MLSIFIVGCGGNSEITSVQPAVAAYDKNVKFVLSGKHLGETLTIKLGNNACSDLKMEDSGKKLNFNCKAPISGDYVDLVVNLNNQPIKNGTIQIGLVEPFQKVDETGQLLVKTSSNWSCVVDNTTGLLWVGQSGIKSNFTYYNHIYQWSKTNENGNFTDCEQTLGVNNACNTFNYIKSLNESNFCGTNKWRLPLSNEIKSILNCISPKYDVDFFPNSKEFYWTATEDKENTSKALIAGFGSCSDASIDKTAGQYTIGVAEATSQIIKP